MALSDEAVAALRRGEPVVLPTDTVYGLAATPFEEDAVARLSALKRRPPTQPIALLAADVGTLVELVPELRGRAATMARALLPGPYTLILPNPGQRYRWLTGSSPETIGVRVPELTGPGAEVVEHVGALVATSANLHGGPESRRLEDVPVEIRAGAAAVVDGGELPGTPSTVLDLTAEEPKVLREGAVPTADALERAAAAFSR